VAITDKCPFRQGYCSKQECMLYIVNQIEPAYSGCAFKDIATSLTMIADELVNRRNEREGE